MPSFSSIAVYVFTLQGLELAQKIAGLMPITVFAPQKLKGFAVCAPRIAEPVYFGPVGDSGKAPPDGQLPCRTKEPARGSGRQLPPKEYPPARSSFKALIAQNFTLFDCHIFIGACGIAVRAIAPHLRCKSVDPAVLVMDQRANNVISLLSGHLGGANAITARLAALLEANPVITTATDVEGLPAIDALAAGRGLAIANVAAVKTVSAALLRGESVLLDDSDDLLGLRDSPWRHLFSRPPADGPVYGMSRIMGNTPVCRQTRKASFCEGRLDSLALPPEQKRCLTKYHGKMGHYRILVGERAPDHMQINTLYLYPKTLACGIGCKKGAPAENILRAIARALAESGHAPAALACIASIDAKRDEAGLVLAAKTLGLPLKFFSPGELAVYPPLTVSAKALERFGIAGVCESAALAAAGGEGGARLLVPKRIENGVTVALAAPVRS